MDTAVSLDMVPLVTADTPDMDTLEWDMLDLDTPDLDMPVVILARGLLILTLKLTQLPKLLMVSQFTMLLLLDIPTMLESSLAFLRDMLDMVMLVWDMLDMVTLVLDTLDVVMLDMLDKDIPVLDTLDMDTLVSDTAMESKLIEFGKFYL